MSIDRSDRTTFNEVAEIYDEARPGYPEQLFKDIISLSGIPDDGKILEVGCGTGKATLPFARRGYKMLCLELGKNLADVAVRNCRSYPQVSIENTTFEDWTLQPGSFDLFISAQAFHWIVPEIGYPKARASLKDSGAIALFWSHYPRPQTSFFKALDNIYKERAPQLAIAGTQTNLEELVMIITDHIDSSGSFEKTLVKRYPWSEEYTAEQYIKLLNTYSDHIRLPDDIRNSLFDAIYDLIERYGGAVERPYLSVLYFAKVRRLDFQVQCT
ncbi:MAG: class I SAM-dependent methyltransferase [Anaerolineaceae bacterium]|nr:class I SAM-dependent methyltransferase [Anaerolineaceae bacterium]